MNRAHLELYQYMKETCDNGKQFYKEDMLRIYNQFVVPNKRPTDPERLTSEQIYNNASIWMNNAISSLVRRGYFGLTFLKDTESLNVDKKELIYQIGG